MVRIRVIVWVGTSWVRSELEDDEEEEEEEEGKGKDGQRIYRYP